jgi:hypothetical protein
MGEMAPYAIPVSQGIAELVVLAPIKMAPVDLASRSPSPFGEAPLFRLMGIC